MTDEEKLRQYLRKVTGELYRYRHGTDKTSADPVVIVGMSCRFPGQVGSPEELWHLIDSGLDAISAFPVDRGWDAENDLGPPQRRVGGFLYEGDRFDAAFFGIEPAEALVLDPQQRLLLETAWEAFEAGGVDLASVRGTRVGVYVGLAASRYAMDAEVSDDLAEHLSTGAASSAASGRIAYLLGLQGPAVTIDTACSSSLVTLHLACQALRAGDCVMALAGGVTFMATPDIFVQYGRRQELAGDGRCKPFSAAADGMGLAEGAGFLLLERLSNARHRGHPVLAVVGGSAVGQDGATNGLTAPSGRAQQRVLMQALADAQLFPGQVDAVEAHGTGSPLGDQIEAQSLISVYGQGRTSPLWLGSVKSNIGHTQIAAGAAGVIKAVLALRHGRLPRMLHAREPMPQIDWDGGHVSLLNEPVAWPRSDVVRRIGVSAFGFTGTNAHVILEEPPAEQPARAAGRPSSPVPWPISAADTAALRVQALRLRELTQAAPADVGFSLAASRTTMRHRAVIVGERADDFSHGLDALSREEPRAVPPYGEIAFVFPARPVPGGGDLYAAFPAFARAMDAIRGQPGETPPFAVEAAIYRLIESFGLVPDYLVGGEGAAQFCLDVLPRMAATGQPGEGKATTPPRALPVRKPSGFSDSRVKFRLGLGPESVLDDPVDACVLEEGVHEPAAFLTALARAYESGAAVDWKAAFTGVQAHLIPLPTYPFQRRRYWLNAGAPATHPLLGSEVVLAAEPGRRYAHKLRPWYAGEYRLFGTPVLPSGAAIEWAIAAWSATSEPRALPVALHNLTIHRLPALPADVQTVTHASGLRCFARSGDSWNEVVTADAGLPPAPPPVAAVAPEAMAEEDVSALYGHLRQEGLQCEGAMRPLTRVWRRGDEVLALVSAMTHPAYILHPATLDACLQTTTMAASGEGLWMPGSVEQICVYGRPQGQLWCQVRKAAADRFDLDIRSDTGELLVLAHGVRLRHVTPGSHAEDAIGWLRARQLTALLFSDPQAARRNLLASLLDHLASLTTAHAAADTRLDRLGLDSLKAVRLRNSLARDFAVDIPISMLLGMSTAADLADVICEQLSAQSILTAGEPTADENVEVLSI